MGSLQKKYQELAIKTIDLLNKNFDDGEKLEMLKVAEALLYGYFCTLSVQIRDVPNIKKNSIEPAEINKLVLNTANFIGHQLALLGVARPNIVGDGC